MEVALKQRLAGASVIIALAVIFIPMVFDNSGVAQNQSISIAIPDEPEDLKRKVMNIDTGHFTNNNDSENQSTNTEIDEGDTGADALISDNKLPIVNKQETIIDVVDNTIETPDSEQINNDQVEDVQDLDSTVTNTISDETQEAEDVNTIERGRFNANDLQNTYRIKYGVFSLQKNAQQLKAKIIDSGNSAIVEKDQESNMYSVYSKELATESEAQNISNKIQKLKLNIGKPSIISFDEASREAAEIMLDTGWIIQIGSFSSKTNSIKLRNKIRNKGFVSFVDEITNSKKQKRYRVRIGPYATRDEASSEKTNISKIMALDGIIKPHEKQKVVNR